MVWRVVTDDLYSGRFLPTLSQGVIGITVFVTLVGFAWRLAVRLRSGSHVAFGEPVALFGVASDLRAFTSRSSAACPDHRAACSMWPFVSGARLLCRAVELGGLTGLGFEPIRTRDFHACSGGRSSRLTIGYSAFIAEVFRAGYPFGRAKDRSRRQSALGPQRLAEVSLSSSFPKRFRTILPPLGNDFIAMVKDSSLVSVLGVTGHHATGQGHGSWELPVF